MAELSINPNKPDKSRHLSGTTRAQIKWLLALFKEDRGASDLCQQVLFSPQILFPREATNEQQGQNIKYNSYQDRSLHSNEVKSVKNAPNVSKIPREGEKPCGSIISISEGISLGMFYQGETEGARRGFTWQFSLEYTKPELLFWHFGVVSFSLTIM